MQVGGIHGLLAVHKPSGMVSKDVSRWLVKRFGKLHLGHVGTLDPGASGVLPILLGRATRLQDHLLDLPKSYEFDVRFGTETDTLDQDGTVVRTEPWEHLTAAALAQAASTFVGAIEQTPPLYSAIKYKGKPLYQYARSGKPEAVPLEALTRKVHVSAFDLLAYGEGLGRFRVTCSKGTYVRTLAKDVADMVGSCGSLSRLVRTRAAGIDLQAAVSLPAIESCGDGFADLVVPIGQIDLGLERWRCPAAAVAARLMAGQHVAVDDAGYSAGWLPCRASDDCQTPTAVTELARLILLLDASGAAFGIGSVARADTGRIVIVIKRGL